MHVQVTTERNLLVHDQRTYRTVRVNVTGFSIRAFTFTLFKKNGGLFCVTQCMALAGVSTLGRCAKNKVTSIEARHNSACHLLLVPYRPIRVKGGLNVTSSSQTFLCEVDL